MIACRGPGDIREVVVAESELSCIGEVGGYVSLDELLTDARLVPCQPSTVTVVRVARWRIRRPGHLGPVDAWKGSEIVVERVILLDDDYDMFNLATGQAGDYMSRHGWLREHGLDLCSCRLCCGSPALLVALLSPSSGLLLDAAEVDLPDECFCDDVEGVDLLLHQNIRYLQRMLGDEEVVVRGNEM